MIGEKSHRFPSQCCGAQECLFDFFVAVIIPDCSYISESSPIHNTRDNELSVGFRIDFREINIPEKVFRQSICKTVFHIHKIIWAHLPGKLEGAL